MVSVKARVPEGTVVELVAVMSDGEDDLSAEDRKALHASLARAAADVDAGRLIDGDAAVEWLRAGRG